MGPALISRIFATDLAVDLGTSNTRVFARGRGLVIEEPTIVATSPDGRSLLAAGATAKAMLGREPASVKVVRPLKSGVIAEPDAALKAIDHFFTTVRGRWRDRFRPRVLVTIPSGITQVERRAVRDVALGAGAREVFLVSAPFAAAVGAGLPIQEAGGNMIVTIGGGTTEVALLSLAGVVHCESSRTGGDEMDEAIVQWVKKHHNLLIGMRQAETIKLALGAARLDESRRQVPVKGLAIVDGLPKTIALTSEEVVEALRESVRSIVDAVHRCLEQTPPELAADIVDKGIVLAGGGASLPALDDVLRDEIGLPITIAEHAPVCAAIGAGQMLDNVAVLRRVAFDSTGGR